MRIEPFLSERLLSVWQNRVKYDFTETGVHPLHLYEFISRDEFDDLFRDVQLRYIQTNGTLPLKEAICELYQGAAPDNVLVTNGSAEANFISVWRHVEPGDEFLVFLPNYMQVPGLARTFGARVVPFPLDDKKGWAPDLDRLATLVSPRTKLIYLSNPNNPTGAILSEAEMREIVRLAEKVGAWILADEVYRGAELGGEISPTFWGMSERVIVVAGLSKAYTLPGLRIGWIVGPKDFVESAWGCHDYTTITTGALNDRLARLAMQPDKRRQILLRNRKISAENLGILQSWLASHPGLFDFIPPKIGGVAFIGYHLNMNSTELVMRVLHEKSVLIVPGDAFGRDGYVRMGYGSPLLLAGLGLISETLESITKGVKATGYGENGMPQGTRAGSAEKNPGSSGR